MRKMKFCFWVHWNSTKKTIKQFHITKVTKCYNNKGYKGIQNPNTQKKVQTNAYLF